MNKPKSPNQSGGVQITEDLKLLNHQENVKLIQPIFRKALKEFYKNGLITKGERERLKRKGSSILKMDRDWLYEQFVATNPSLFLGLGRKSLLKHLIEGGSIVEAQQLHEDAMNQKEEEYLATLGG